MIRTLHDAFYINPLPSHVIRKNEFNAGQPHVIYRRSIEEFSSTCHFSGINSLVLLVVVVVVTVVSFSYYQNFISSPRISPLQSANVVLIDFS